MLVPNSHWLCLTLTHAAPTQNTFELYGADFMLSDNMQPWLLEVNSSPTMACTTQATDHLVNALMEDIVKGKRPTRDTSVVVVSYLVAYFGLVVIW